MFRKILIANRGEIALRILRTCHEMGIKTVAVHSQADEDAMHVRLADEAVCIGPPRATESYLNIPAIVAAAEITGAEAIHPGYGFLSENANFATIVSEHGLKFIGPDAQQVKLMGNKIEAKRTALNLGLPPLPGSQESIKDIQAASQVANKLGFPIIIKAAAGGGGRGMKIAENSNDLHKSFLAAKTEAKAFFGDDTLYIEKFFQNPRHIEVQILCDGKTGSVFFAERDCSIQRRHQKVIEESPSPGVSPESSKQLGKSAAEAMLKLGYKGVGTLEFLFANGDFYFIEMNTRIQVEHTVTEEISGIDLVREQIRIAADESLGYGQESVNCRGHAIECRIMAENPKTFVPNAGRITEYHTPGGPGVRVDSALYSGYTVPSHYDSLISKIIVSATSREKCLMRLNQALKEYVIGGIQTTLPLHLELLKNNDFKAGDYNIHWLEDLIRKNGSQ